MGAVTVFLELVIATTICLAVRHLRSYERFRRPRRAGRAEERERGARALQLQGQRFDTALNNMLQGLLMFDQAGRLLVVNRRFCRMFGVPDGALAPGMTYRELTDARRRGRSGHRRGHAGCARASRGTASRAMSGRPRPGRLPAAAPSR